MDDQQFQFEWDELKALANIRKHDISFELATSVFADQRLLTVADVRHAETEERWFSIGSASGGLILSLVYLWKDSENNTTKIRLISARRATRSETRHYVENL